MATYEVKLRRVAQLEPTLSVLVHAANAYVAARAAERHNPGYRAYLVAVWVEGVRVDLGAFRRLER
ncbi:hypothetical protein QSH18_18670 [Xanthomonas sp. NCPPB 2654]|uniref:hypothetical protein n=1 Tax=unclassified Xanthomonas TaxID=2643310 RepID=UPI0021E0FB6C|nr:MULTISPECIES: hypothetical protein [unclassified Xanthomonas]MDL5367635.1 hypothetical protein [Xanthomonas sp. NCPPB 2654]MDR6673708.1 hypothetical protein [Xanthomonas translucens]MEB1529668.1 hypothetical protein [Xanthomonas campestris pv. campestris]UYC19244.1 hypothetical protein NUG20_13770 [Xanthomonas sp. CFBP 8443]